MRTPFALASIPLSFALLLGVPQAAPGPVADPPGDGVSFDFTPRPDAHQSPYIISVAVHGLARYIEFSANDRNGPAARPVIFAVSAPMMQRLLSAQDSVALASTRGGCESRRKGIASTGKKLLTYYQGGHGIACTFDYTENASVEDVVAAFQAIVETMQYGGKLEHLHRYDRLGLDAEIDSLLAENQAGHALELQNIAPVLQSIFDDDRVMERVRRKAGRLLQQAGVPVSADAGASASSP